MKSKICMLSGSEGVKEQSWQVGSGTRTYRIIQPCVWSTHERDIGYCCWGRGLEQVAILSKMVTHDLLAKVTFEQKAWRPKEQLWRSSGKRIFCPSNQVNSVLFPGSPPPPRETVLPSHIWTLFSTVSANLLHAHFPSRSSGSAGVSTSVITGKP